MITSLLILAISFIATLLSSMSGAGSALITVPVWLMLGYSLPAAQAANKVNGALWTPIPVRNYLRSRDVDWRLLAGLAACGPLGSYLGSIFFVSVESQLLQRIIGGVILCLVAFAFIHKEFGVELKAPAASRVLTSLLAIPLGFYEAFLARAMASLPLLYSPKPEDSISFWRLVTTTAFLSSGASSLPFSSCIGGLETSD